MQRSEHSYAPADFPNTSSGAAVLATLVIAFLRAMADLTPANASHQEPLNNLRSGRTSTVQVDTNRTDVYALWSTGFLLRKQEAYRFPEASRARKERSPDSETRREVHSAPMDPRCNSLLG